RRDLPGALRPALERRAREGRQVLVPVDPERLLEDDAVRPHARERVGEPEARARELRDPVGVRQQPLAQPRPPPFRALGARAVDELREVELERVTVARRVRALHLAQLALEAGVEDALLL